MISIQDVFAALFAESLVELYDESEFADHGEIARVTSADDDGVSVVFDDGSTQHFDWDDEFSIRINSDAWHSVGVEDDGEYREPLGTEQMENNDFAQDDCYFDSYGDGDY